MTSEQAAVRAEQLIQEASAKLPAGTTLEKENVGATLCDGGFDDDERVEVKHEYVVRLSEPWPASRIFDALDEFWKSRGYQLKQDNRRDQTFPDLSYNDSGNKMVVGFSFHPGTGEMELWAYSGCVPGTESW